MAKNFREIYEAEPELREMRRLRTPDIMTERVSSWTYADMKREKGGITDQRRWA